MNKPKKPAPRASTAKAQSDSSSEPIFLPPLRPHPKLTIVLGLILAAWMIGLLVAYFKTVYPLRHDQPRTTQTVIAPR
jgi:BioD-like phosphotransacetylase family protein